MARAATAGELEDFRKDGQTSKRYLLIDRPNTIYTARATGEVNVADYTLGFDGGAGTLGDCLADMTLLIGSAAGGYDVGIARLRKAPIAGTFYLGADPSLEVSDDDYLTVINDFELWAKHPFDTSLDVDVAYSDQFTNFSPVGLAKGRVRVIDEEGTAEFDAADCWVPGAAISSYAWTFTGASSTTGTTTATPTATYNTSGRYRWSLAVTADNGKSSTIYGWVYVLGDNLSPEDEAVFEEPECDENGDWTVQVLMYDRPEDIYKNRRAIFYTRERYGDETVSIGPITSAENIVLVGWILGETIRREPGMDTVEFTVGGPVSTLRRIQAMEVGLVDTTYPTDAGAALPAWSRCAGLTATKMLQHLAINLSTIAKVIDFDVEDWEWPAAYTTAGKNNLYEQLVDVAGTAALEARGDRYGRLIVERDAQLYPVASRDANIPVVLTLTDEDWHGELTAIKRQGGETAVCSAEGHLFGSGALTPVGGRSPGEQPARFGEDGPNLTDIFFDTQDSALELAGLMAGWKNGEIEAILVPLLGNLRLIDVAPRQYVDVEVDGTTYRCAPRGVRLREGAGNFMFPQLELDPRGGQWPAVAITYPGEGEPPSEPQTEPPEEAPTPPSEPPETPEVSDVDAVAAILDDIRTTDDFDEASPTWTTELS